MGDHHHEKHRTGITLAAAGLFIALGITAGGYFVGNMVYKSKVATNIATVKGLAEREVVADIGTWSVNFEASENSLAKAYDSANSAKEKVNAFLKTAGFAEEVTTQNAFSVMKSDSRDSNQRLIETTYIISGSVSVRSTDVQKIAKAAQQVGDLVGQGVILTNSYPQYLFTKLNDIKPEMLGEATRNARVAAEQFAKDANAHVGSINSAEQGAFNFSARDAGENGGDETASINKKVRVVTTISFYLKD